MARRPGPENVNDLFAPDTEILKIAPDGTISTLATGLRLVLGMAVDTQGNLFFVEVTGRGSCSPTCTG